MSKVVENAIKSLNSTVNISTGLSHPNDMNRVREMFAILHNNGEVLLKKEIEALAQSQGWSAEDADELGSLGQQIGEGKKVRIEEGPWWGPDIYANWSKD